MELKGKIIKLELSSRDIQEVQIQLFLDKKEFLGLMTLQGIASHPWTIGQSLTVTIQEK